MGYPETVAILGALGGGELVYWTLHACHPDIDVVFLDDKPPADYLELGGRRFPVYSDWQLEEARRGRPDAFRQFLPSSTLPRIKRALVQKALAAGMVGAPPVVHPQAFLWGGPSITLGAATILHPHAVVGPRCNLGNYVHVFPNALLGHHINVGDFSAIHSNSNVSGYVEIAEGVQVGAGCSVREHLHILPWATLGMQSAVLVDVEAGQCVVGVPAHPMRARDAEPPKDPPPTPKTEG